MSPSQNNPPSLSFYDLLNACSQPGCPICRVGAQSVKRYLKSIFYEFVNDPVTRENLVKSLGFCGEHVHLLLDTKIADALGASIIYENIIKKILRELPTQSSSLPAQTKERSRAIGRFVSASDQAGNCIACEQRNTAFERALHEISEALGEERLQAALQESEGLCFPHLAQLSEKIQKSEHMDFLLTLTRTKLEQRQAEMVELIRKNDYRNNSEGITFDEAMAWKKTMCMVSGVSISLTGDKNS